MSKKALMVVSFGTSFGVAMPAIINIEETCKREFPDYDFYRAFTSGMIIRKLKRTRDIVIDNPDDVMKKLVEQGYDEVLCQPTHIINGVEYEKMIRMLEAYRDKIPVIRVGKPLLTEEEDYRKACEIMIGEVEAPLPKDEAYVLMGHGTEHYSNSAYSQFENMMRYLGYENTYVGTVEGFPGLDYVIDRMKKRNIKKVTLIPLMIVAGDHARNDLAGEDADSWDSILKAEGFETKVLLKGMGELDAVANMYVEHLKNAKQLPGAAKKGKIYGVGIGPGDAELMTLKACRLLEKADVVAVPVKEAEEESVALNIARGAVAIPEEKVLRVLFKMDKDKAKREACREAAAEELMKYLDAGKNIVMPVLGDVSIYSTYSYVHKRLAEAGYEVEMVAGIPSFCAGASKASISLVEGKEGFGVIPSLKGLDQVEKALDTFDNLVIMKAGSHVKDVYEILKARGMEDNAIIVSNVGLEGEYVGPLMPDKTYGYFTTMIIKSER
ncbi:MAG: precorrin-2 C(20)-methyltransferase [Eubacteriales bacterium]|nr:precorrin-2 C(20)-methyltransferase [Eubacteriales bacterium]